MKSKKKIVSTPKAPAAIGPYSQAVIAGNLLFTSGQIALIPETGLLVQGNVEEEIHQVMRNLSAILTAANLTFDHVVKTSIFLKDMNDFATVNEIYTCYFSKDYPARETVQVARLPKDVRVEISMIALLD
jgi:2-iminobutanoate/2-iminopropanoate deaminase